MTQRKPILLHRMRENIRDHATAMLDASGAVIFDKSGLRLRSLTVGMFTIFEAGPAEWSVYEPNWTLDLFQRGRRLYSAQWHKPDPTLMHRFTDGFECLQYERSDYDDWPFVFLRLKPPPRAVAVEAV